jgi:multiple sugar transport system permease protein
MSEQTLTKTNERGGIRVGQRRFIFGVVSPTVLYSVGFTLLAIIWALALMFFDYSPGRAGGPILGLGGNNPYVGLQHFANMLSGTSLEARLFRISLKNTIIFALIVLPLNLLITLPLATLIESVSGKFKTIFRAIYFLPAVTSSVGVALMWQYLYHPQQGLFNAVIRALGGHGVAWLTDPRAYFLGISVGMWAVIVARLWQDYGYNLVIFIAALQGIPKEFKEAAMIDGANPFQLFRYITVPLLKPTLTFVCVMTMLSSFQVFDIIQVMTNGGPNNQTRVLVIDIYENAFRYQSMGWSAAVSFVLVGLIMFITLVQMRLLRTDWEY